MTELKPKFNPETFEVYGASNYYTDSQLEDLKLTSERVNQQLDWVAQLLGWSGTDYWYNLPSNIAQKRNLLVGTFGVYNSFVVPEIREIRNWDNTVVVKSDDRLEVGQIAYLGDNSYTVQGITVDGDNYILDIGTLTEQFLNDVSSNLQLKVDVKLARPCPFNNSIQNSADITLSVKIVAPNTMQLVLSDYGGVGLTIVNNSFFQGSRLSFDAPVFLSLVDVNGSSPEIQIDAEFDFSTGMWVLELPGVRLGYEAKLKYGAYELPVNIVPWSFSGGWGDLDILNNFTGVWGNKGGKLPYHFVFDSLGIHGCDPEKSVSLEPLETSLSFNTLLDLIYYQKAQTSPQPVSSKNGRNQVWWNGETGALSVYMGKCLNCGPWAEIEYPHPPEETDPVGYVFSTVQDFRSYSGIIEPDCIIRILDGNGLNNSDDVYGLTGAVTSACKVDLTLLSKSNLLIATFFEFNDSNSFELNATVLPGKVPVKVKDASGLTEVFGESTIKNLSAPLSKPYPVILTKDATVGVNEWYISPPSNLKYIGETRLFDGGEMADGQLFWDYSETNIESRNASVFYYNRWEKQGGVWVLKGDWVQVNQNESTSTPDPVINYGVLKVFCNGVELVDGETYLEGNFQITYSSGNGKFKFNYEAVTFRGISKLPRITLTDSLTTTFQYDITDFVFSGLTMKLNPNPLDANTPLRIWKSEPLTVAESESSLSTYRVTNALVADDNSGPAGENWEQYFIRMSPLLGRDGSKWQKTNLVCQNFGLWGTTSMYESMEGPGQDDEVTIYEEAVLSNVEGPLNGYLYSEPYLYSTVIYENGYQEEFENSAIVPGYDEPYDGFEEAVIEGYDPLHFRQIITDNDSKFFGDWKGTYLRASECSELTGEISVDIVNNSVQELMPPMWDYSIYKMPSKENESLSVTPVDANHFRVGYAFFSADLSAAEEPCFDVG